MTTPAGTVSRLARWAVRLWAPLVPSDRRDAWVRQWTADLLCHAAWRLDRGDRPAAVERDLVARSAGAGVHAATLRLRQWRHTMLGQDIKYAWRNILRRPGFTAAIVLTLGLGVGANATIFSWIDALALSPLPSVPRPQELRLLRFASPTRNDLSFSYLNYLDVNAARPDGLTGLAVSRFLSLGLRTTGEPERVWAEVVSGNFFTVLDVRAALGRTLTDADTSAVGAQAVAVISDRLWRARFGGNTGVIGQPVHLNGHPFTIVGVTPPGFAGASNGLAMDLWVPVTMHPQLTGRDVLSARGSGWLSAIGRRDPAVTDAAMASALRTMASRMAADHRILDTWTLAAAPLSAAGASQVLLPVVGVVMAVVGIVLLIACANVSSLLLSRAVSRQREVTIRAALGATRLHLIRQLLIESLMLATLGGLAGVALASWTSRALGALLPPMPFPVAIAASVNPRVLLFSAAVVLATTVVFGLAPALQGSRTALQHTLRTGAGGGAPSRRTRLRRTLVIVEVALATVLLVSAGLFVRTLARANDADPGFSERQAVLASVDLSAIGLDDTRGRAFYGELTRALSALPEVKHAAITTLMPLSVGGGADTSPEIEGYTPQPNEEVVVFYGMVGPGFFDTIGVPLVAGRALDATDRQGQAGAVVINETMARRYWPGRSALGGRLKAGDDWVTVVGIARDGKYGQINEAPRNVMFFPIDQVYRPVATVVIATRGPAGPATAAIRKAVSALSPDLVLSDIRTMDEHLGAALAVPRIGAILLAVFGGLALLLAAVGLYGVVAFSVSQRTREIGVRIALGAHGPRIVRQVLGEAAWMAGIGLAAGLGLALASSSAVASLMINMSPIDAPTYLATASILVLVTLTAAWLPARRASRVNPVDALRAD